MKAKDVNIKQELKKEHGTTKDKLHQINLPSFLVGEKQYLISVGMQKMSHPMP